MYNVLYFKEINMEEDSLVNELIKNRDAAVNKSEKAKKF
jgi:hypothetical protein